MDIKPGWWDKPSTPSEISRVLVALEFEILYNMSFSQSSALFMLIQVPLPTKTARHSIAFAHFGRRISDLIL